MERSYVFSLHSVCSSLYDASFVAVFLMITKIVFSVIKIVSITDMYMHLLLGKGGGGCINLLVKFYRSTVQTEVMESICEVIWMQAY